MSETALDDFLIREIAPADASAAATLTGELGYSVSAGIMRQRIEALIGLPDHAIYVACRAGEVVGWIHVTETRHLSVEPRAEIGGLVVASQVRSLGIGRRLVARAEAWARVRGLATVLVRSRESRERAHRFYLREGYQRVKISAVFTKQLGAALTEPRP
jgi:GNAT superfamily N-acetyltransferase